MQASLIISSLTCDLPSRNGKVDVLRPLQFPRLGSSLQMSKSNPVILVPWWPRRSTCAWEPLERNYWQNPEDDKRLLHLIALLV
eukprot:526401-Amphidinium_carterae.1